MVKIVATSTLTQWNHKLQKKGGGVGDNARGE